MGPRALGLSCSEASGIFPDQGSNPCPLHWQACHQRSPKLNFLQPVSDSTSYSTSSVVCLEMVSELAPCYAPGTVVVGRRALRLQRPKKPGFSGPHPAAFLSTSLGLRFSSLARSQLLSGFLGDNCLLKSGFQSQETRHVDAGGSGRLLEAFHFAGCQAATAFVGT